ncbi:MAG: hypothetical protein F6K15_09215 [Okeania sp. SIO2B3]|nr:hypothetical protein [Okeania sp. SIO2B3]
MPCPNNSPSLYRVGMNCDQWIICRSQHFQLFLCHNNLLST